MTISIRARKGSFWRAGIRHTETPVAYEEDAFTDEQLAALRAESKLIVEGDARIAIDAPADGSVSTSIDGDGDGDALPEIDDVAPAAPKPKPKAKK